MDKSPINDYISFWTRYMSICNRHRLNVSPNAMPFTAKPEGCLFRVRLNEPIYLQDWLANSTSHKKIDILLDGSEVVDPKKSVIIKSSVNVNYFDTSKKGAKVLKPLESIHYDYEDSQNAGHPIFHAQVSESLITSFSDSFNRYRVAPVQLDGRLKGIRIPTAHMSIISVLITLIADHTGRKTKESGIKKVGNKIPKQISYAPVLEEIMVEMKKRSHPMACCKKLHEMIGKEFSSFRSLLWYPEFT